MIDIKKEKEFDLKKIYGEKLYNKFVKNYSVLTNEDVSAWLRDKISKFTDKGKNAKDFKITSYMNALQQYCNYNEVKDPSKLLTEDIDTRNLRVKKYIDFLLNANSEAEIQKIREIGFRKVPSEVSVRNLIQSRIKSYYSARGSPISYGIDTAKHGENIREVHLDRESIMKIASQLETADYRLICKLQTQLGLRISDILKELTSGKYNIEKYKEHYFIKAFRTGKLAVVINFMFFTEELTQLIQSTYGIEDLRTLDLKTILRTRRGTPINKANYLERVKQIAQHIGIEGNIKTHSFRKYFRTQVNSCPDVSKELKEHLMGHQEKNLAGAYETTLSNIDEFYSLWLKIEPLVCIDCIIKNNTSKEILNVKEKYEQLLKENIKKDKTITELQQNVDYLSQQFKDMAKLMKQLAKDSNIDIQQENNNNEEDESHE